MHTAGAPLFDTDNQAEPEDTIASALTGPSWRCYSYDDNYDWMGPIEVKSQELSSEHDPMQFDSITPWSLTSEPQAGVVSKFGKLDKLDNLEDLLYGAAREVSIRAVNQVQNSIQAQNTGAQAQTEIFRMMQGLVRSRDRENDNLRRENSQLLIENAIQRAATPVPPEPEPQIENVTIFTHLRPSPLPQQIFEVQPHPSGRSRSSWLDGARDRNSQDKNNIVDLGTSNLDRAPLPGLGDSTPDEGSGPSKGRKRKLEMEEDEKKTFRGSWRGATHISPDSAKPVAKCMENQQPVRSFSIDTIPNVSSPAAEEEWDQLGGLSPPKKPDGSLSYEDYSVSLEASSAPDLPIVVEPEEDITDQYISQGILGKGAYAVVEKVLHKASGQVFARKCYIAPAGPNAEYSMFQFRNEIDIMKSLSGHHHMIEYVGSYSKGRQHNLLVQPVADTGSLADYLHEIRERGQPTTRERELLLRAIGCLASGLAFIHKKTIRHKDIKPENILIHQGKVIYTDFGISLDSTGYQTTTDGIPFGFTTRYCAPEIFAKPPLPRNRRSDIFSLGCVYCEILSALQPKYLPYHVLKAPYMENLNLFGNLLISNMEPEGDFTFTLTIVCRALLRLDNRQRPDALNVERYLFHVPTTLQTPFAGCELCASYQPAITEVERKNAETTIHPLYFIEESF